MESLTVAIPTRAAGTSSDVPVAIVKGFFKAHHLDVTLLDGLGSNVANVVTSGQADIGYLSDAGPLTIAQKGKDTTIIRALHGGGVAANLAAGPNIKSLDDLRAKQGCKIGSLPAPSLTFGDASLILKALNLKNCELRTFADPPSEAGALVAGNVDAAVSSYQVFQSALDAGKVHLLIDTTKPQDLAKLGNSLHYVEVVYFGLSGTITSKKSAVVKFLAGIDDAINYLKSTSPADVAAVLHSYPSYAAKSIDQITRDVRTSVPFFDVGSDHGVISETAWTTALDRMKFWGLEGYDPSAEVNSYAKRVDMSYERQAQAK